MRDWKQYTQEAIKTIKLQTKKSYGQNFLIRYRVANQIVEHATILPTDSVLEIGGGFGILTEALVATDAQITVIEKDDKLAEFLTKQFEGRENVSIVHDDALRCDWPENCKVVANLPYAISSPLIDRFFHAEIKDATVMVQREVGLRCLAKPGSDHYSRLTVLCNIHGKVRRVMDISPDSFYPVPEVNSMVISIQPREIKLQNNHEDLELLTRNLFSLKRRIVRSVVRGYLKRKTDDTSIWEDCPYNQSRIFDLSVSKIDEILTHLKAKNAWPLT